MRISDWSSDVRSSDLYGFETISPYGRLVGRTQLLYVGTFTITYPGGAIDGTNLQVDGVDAFSVQGSTLKGLAGTIYEGMTLAYGRDTSDAGAAAKDITITTTLGIAERLYQRLEN